MTANTRLTVITLRFIPSFVVRDTKKLQLNFYTPRTRLTGLPPIFYAEKTCTMGGQRSGLDFNGGFRNGNKKDRKRTEKNRK